MKIGIIGAGNIGSSVAKLFSEAGHEVAISNSRGPDSLSGLANSLGRGVIAVTANEAATFGQILLVAIPLNSYKSVPNDVPAETIVIDANNYYPGRDGEIAQLSKNEITSSELLAQHLTNKPKLVKAFNTIYFGDLQTRGQKDKPVAERHAIFLAGDSKAAKEIVSKLIEEIGFAPVDTGTLRDGGRRQQPGTSLYNQRMTGAQALSLV